jgi:hypothetical protein
MKRIVTPVVRRRKQEMWERTDRDLKKEKIWKRGKGVFGERKEKKVSIHAIRALQNG